MFNSGVYRIEFTKSSLELNDDYEKLSDIEIEKLSKLSAKSYFDFEDNNCYICYIITTPLEMDKYLNILKKNYIEHTSINISGGVLRNKHNFNKLKDNLDSFNSIKWDFFIEDLDEWIMENLDIDIILDVISEVGIEKMTEIQKKFLDNYNK